MGGGERDGEEPEPEERGPPALQAERSPSDPAGPMSSGTPSEQTRAVGAWRSWLGALASDAEAALAAGMTYAALPDEGRDAWLDALERDRGSVDVPRVALYAPLLAVEVDDARRARIAYHMGAIRSEASGGKALSGRTAKGDRVCAIATPLYLDFVEVLVCRYDPDGGVRSAHHEPFRHASQVASAVESALEETILLTPAPLRDVVDDLAHAVVADRREGRTPPEALARFSHLFNPTLEEDCPAA
jgi:hypothetical protein